MATSLGNSRQQHLPARVQRIDGESTPARAEGQGRIDKAHIPARISPRKLEAGRKKDAAPIVERLGQRIVGGPIKTVLDLPLDADAALGHVAGLLHRNLLRAASRVPGRFALEAAKAARNSEAASLKKDKERPPESDEPPPRCRLCKPCHSHIVAAETPPRNHSSKIPGVSGRPPHPPPSGSARPR